MQAIPSERQKRMGQENPTKAERPNIDWVDGAPLTYKLPATTFDQLRAAYLYDERQRIVDAVFKVAEDEGWCNATLTALNVVFPDGSPWSDGEWRTTEGYDCYGWDIEGYNASGYNRYGVDREGKNANGETGQWCTACQMNHG